MVKNVGQEAGNVTAMSFYQDLDFAAGGPSSRGWIKCLTWMFAAETQMKRQDGLNTLQREGSQEEGTLGTKTPARIKFPSPRGTRGWCGPRGEDGA